MRTGKLADTSVRVWSDSDAEEIHSDLYYGKFVDDYLRLSLVEALHLVEREELDIEVEEDSKDKEELLHLFSDIDEDFEHKYAVYTDLRERGYVVKTGFKFGAHFRVYPRGVNPYKDGPKEDREHTKWIVHAVPENYNQDYQDMARAVRLAQNIRAKMLWGVVDTENQVTYFEVERATP